MIKRQLVRYAIVGLANTTVGLFCIFFAMAVFGLQDITANALGYGIGFFLSYGLNRSWTFQHNGAIGRSLSYFAILVVVSYFCNLLVMVGASRGIGINSYEAQLLGVCTYTTLVFLGSRYFAFAPPSQMKTTIDRRSA
jgi:putative flippase GtrA